MISRLTFSCVYFLNLIDLNDDSDKFIRLALKVALKQASLDLNSDSNFD